MANIPKINPGDLATKIPAVRRIKSLFSGAFDMEPARAYMFEVSIDSGSSLFVDKLKGDFIRFHAKSATLPQRSVELLRMPQLGKVLFFAGKDNAQHTMSLSFWDSEQMEVYNYLTDWMKILNEGYTGRQVTKYLYTRTININVRDVNDLVNIKKLKLLNAFPIEIADVPMSYENGEPLEILATFAFEEIIDDPKIGEKY